MGILFLTDELNTGVVDYVEEFVKSNKDDKYEVVYLKSTIDSKHLQKEYIYIDDLCDSSNASKVNELVLRLCDEELKQYISKYPSYFSERDLDYSGYIRKVCLADFGVFRDIANLILFVNEARYINQYKKLVIVSSFISKEIAHKYIKRNTEVQLAFNDEAYQSIKALSKSKIMRYLYFAFQNKRNNLVFNSGKCKILFLFLDHLGKRYLESIFDNFSKEDIFVLYNPVLTTDQEDYLRGSGYRYSRYYNCNIKNSVKMAFSNAMLYFATFIKCSYVSDKYTMALLFKLFELFTGARAIRYMYEEVLSKCSPDVVFSYCETESGNTILEKLREKYSFKTVNIMHGITAGEQFKRYMNFDSFIVWGQYYKDIFSKHEENKDQFVVLGNPYFDKITNYKCNIVPVLEEIKSKYKLITVFSQYSRLNGVSKTEKLSFLSSIKKYIEENKNTYLCIKLHPRENVRGNGMEIRMFDGMTRCMVVKNDFELYDLINYSDLVVSYSSTTILESILFKKPVLVFNLSKSDKLPFKKEASVVELNSVVGVEETINKLLYDSTFLNELEKGQETTINLHANGCDGRSTERVVSFLKDMLKNLNNIN